MKTCHLHTLTFLALALGARSVAGQPFPLYGWTNYVGKPGGRGNVDGVGSDARLLLCYAAAFDNLGNLFITDYSAIRKATPDRVVTTFAGKLGTSGTNDGAADVALFDLVCGIALDGSGNAYISEAFKSTIRKMTPAGVVSTLAGIPGINGSADGTGSAARFNQPSGVAVNSLGEVFVADCYNNTIRKITPAGVVTTVAGTPGASGSTDGIGSAARFIIPDGLAVDSSDNLLITDSGSHTIRKMTPAAVVTTLAGLAGTPGNTDGTNAVARFRNPYGIAPDNLGNLYVADTGNHTIRRISAAGQVSTIAGSPGVAGAADGAGSAARFNNPSWIIVSPTGDLIVADYYNFALRRVTPAGVVTTIAGCLPGIGTADGTNSDARFDVPSHVAVDPAGNLYVADSRNYTVRKVTPEGRVTTLAGSPGTYGTVDGTGSAAQFFSPSGVAAAADGTVYVADYRTLRKVTSAGVVTTLAGAPWSTGTNDGVGGAARFTNPRGAALDSAGNIYVTDGHGIRRITPACVVTTLAGIPTTPGDADGAGSAARFNTPFGVTAARNGDLFVADTWNSAIRKVTQSGEVTTFAGRTGVIGSNDGPPDSARFFRPYAITADAEGNLFVADSANETVRKITAAGVVTTIGGLPSVESGVEGVGSSARFGFPTGIAVDARGSIYVADQWNNNIWKGTSIGMFFDTSTGRFGMTPDGFQLTVCGLMGRGPLTIYVSTNLTSWGVLLTQPAVTGTVQVIDTNATGPGVRFYRASE